MDYPRNEKMVQITAKNQANYLSNFGDPKEVEYYV